MSKKTHNLTLYPLSLFASTNLNLQSNALKIICKLLANMIILFVFNTPVFCLALLCFGEVCLSFDFVSAIIIYGAIISEEMKK